MSTAEPYVEYKPGELIAAEVMNKMQSDIREDIAGQTQAAIEAINQVPSARDAERLEGQSLADITQAIIDQALSEVARHSGYSQLFKRLKVGRETIIEHNLKNCPLVDLYQLDYFEVVASEDDHRYRTWVNFFLYHSSEQRILFGPAGEGGSKRVSVVIERTTGGRYRIPCADMLARYKVDYNDNSSLAEIVTELWKAMFGSLSDRFDDDQHAHSPWFDRCCREGRIVKYLKERGHWDDLWFKMVPRKTVNYPYEHTEVRQGGVENTWELEVPEDSDPLPMPTQVHVSHFDFNNLGLLLLREPVYSPEVIVGLGQEGRDIAAIGQELKLMVLLRA
jgi:hypothetical protein